MPADQAKLNEFMGQFVGESGSALNAALVVLGERLGLYKAMADSAPISSAELAAKTNTSEPYVREWLSAQAGEARMSDVVTKGGCKIFRRATQTPFNMVFEARP